MPRRFFPPLLLLLAALCWSFGGVLIKSIAWPPMAIAGGRSAIAIPVLLLSRVGHDSPFPVRRLAARLGMPERWRYLFLPLG
jgi:drug/metabolite transporter (DMT)-like permease